MLELRAVCKSRGGRVVVASVDLRVEGGEALCLTGPSGVGKTTLLEMMAGVLSPDSGVIRRTALPSLLFQENALIPWLTAEGNILYILPPTLPREEAVGRSAFWLRRFGLAAGSYPAAMSGGMKRRLALARTFASGRSLLLLDEPFAFLDDDWQTLVAEEIDARTLRGAAVVVASHETKPLLRFTKTCRRILSVTSPLVIS